MIGDDGLKAGDGGDGATFSGSGTMFFVVGDGGAFAGECFAVVGDGGAFSGECGSGTCCFTVEDGGLLGLIVGDAGAFVREWIDIGDGGAFVGEGGAFVVAVVSTIAEFGPTTIGTSAW